MNTESPSIRDSPELQIRIHGDPALPTLLYLPGLHGDWTLLGRFREQLTGRARLVEVTYPRRPEWLLADYAAAVISAVNQRQIGPFWVVGESFSSQVAWELLAQGEKAQLPIAGLILVGGFIRHPWPWGVRLAHQASSMVPLWMLRRACSGYGWLARRRCAATAFQAELKEFVIRRVNEPDRKAITSRYRLISANDPRTIATHIKLPVFHLSGGLDPIVPWWQVRPWLRRHCPGFAASRILWRRGHNVLLSAPRESAEQILKWTQSPHVP